MEYLCPSPVEIPLQFKSYEDLHSTLMPDVRFRPSFFTGSSQQSDSVLVSSAVDSAGYAEEDHQQGKYDCPDGLFHSRNETASPLPLNYASLSSSFTSLSTTLSPQSLLVEEMFPESAFEVPAAVNSHRLSAMTTHSSKQGRPTHGIITDLLEVPESRRIRCRTDSFSNGKHLAALSIPDIKTENADSLPLSELSLCQRKYVRVPVRDSHHGSHLMGDLELMLMVFRREDILFADLSCDSSIRYRLASSMATSRHTDIGRVSDSSLRRRRTSGSLASNYPLLPSAVKQRVLRKYHSTSFDASKHESAQAPVRHGLRSEADRVRLTLNGPEQHKAAKHWTQKWLHASYTVGPDSAVSRQALYHSYTLPCAEFGVRPTDNATFGKAVLAAFPGIKHRRLGKRKFSKYHYISLQPVLDVEKQRLNEYSISSSQSHTFPSYEGSPTGNIELDNQDELDATENQEALGPW